MSKFKAGDTAYLVTRGDDGEVVVFERVRIEGPHEWPGADWVFARFRDAPRGASSKCYTHQLMAAGEALDDLTNNVMHAREMRRGES